MTLSDPGRWNARVLFFLVNVQTYARTVLTQNQCRYVAENNTRVGLAHSMASTGARAYNGGLGASPQWWSRGQSPRWQSGGTKPP